jgi:ABC-type lipoprotein release transport system permease subunit
MSKRDRLITAIAVLVIVLGFMGYITYLRVMYDTEIDITLGFLASAMGYMLRWIQKGNGGTE